MTETISEHQLRSADLLRAALRETTGEGPSNALMRQSLLAAVANDPYMRAVYDDETAPKQVELDLHLEGVGVEGHQTNAMYFGQFVTRIAEAVKAAAKELTGQLRYRPTLLVQGAGQGSVRVVLQAPEPKPGNQMDRDELELAAPTADSQALRLIAGAMSAASEGDDADNDGLRAMVEVLPATAHKALRSAAQVADRAGWDITGSVTQRHHGREQVRLTRRGARRLAELLTRDLGEPKRETVTGEVDGLKYSLASMWFMPSGTRRSFRAGVPTRELLEDVGALAQHQRALAEFDTYMGIREPDGEPYVQARVLRKITPLGEAGVPTSQEKLL